MLSRALFRAESGIDRSPWSDYWYGPVGAQTLSGIRVGVESALSASPVWAAVRLLADSVASLPLVIFKRRADGGKDRAPDHPIYDLLHDAPNPLMTAANFRRVMMVWALLWGNAYAEIRPGRRGTVDTLWPLHPDGVRIESIPGGKVRYQVRQTDGTDKAYDDEAIFHIPGLSLNGISGMNLMQVARESIGLNIAAKQFSSGFFSRGGRPSGVLTHPGKLTKDGRQNMREEWETIHAGSANAHRVAILQEGVTWAATGMTSEDAQLLGLLEWSAADIARYFNVPLHLLQETAKVTSWGSGIEELNSAFVTYSLLPWLVNWQQTITKDLIVFNQFFFAEFIVDALLRGKTLERYQAYQIASNDAAWLTANEIRASENRNPVPGGDELQKAPDPRPPAAPPSNQPKQPDALAEALARDTAARIVRRETAALGRVAQRGPLSPDAWAEAVGDFYAEHAPFVAEALHLDRVAVGGYIRKQVDTLIAAGPEAATNWEAERVEYLTTLALEAQE